MRRKDLKEFEEGMKAGFGIACLLVLWNMIF